MIVRGVASPERLLDETVRLLNRVEANLPERQRKMLDRLRVSDPWLAGRTVLLVDDDIRNIFALTSLLERHRLRVLHAENARAGIDLLRRTDSIEAVLMDIMMPDMDGFEAIRHIRAMGGFDNLPIIAVTAKAMKGDREKCIKAGANDYITKPVDLDHLFAILRVWLPRREPSLADDAHELRSTGATR
jgi:CheY-like chemotaxis protein